jgi:hypothetical protein
MYDQPDAVNMVKHAMMGCLRQIRENSMHYVENYISSSQRAVKEREQKVVRHRRARFENCLIP